MEAGQSLSEALSAFGAIGDGTFGGATPTPVAGAQATTSEGPLVNTQPPTIEPATVSAQAPSPPPPAPNVSGGQAPSPQVASVQTPGPAASKPDVGAIVGGVIGGVICCLLVGALVFYFCVWRQKRALRTIQGIEETAGPPPPFEIDEALLPPAYDPQWSPAPLSPISVAQLNEKRTQMW